MKSFLSFLLLQIWKPIHSFFIFIVAYGPWGPLHSLFIRIFKKLYGIQYPADRHFKTLGEFFLRPIDFKIGDASLVSPAESILIDGPAAIDLTKSISVKGLEYAWSDFREINIEKFKAGMFWNFYLAPRHYHWVHSPCDGHRLEGIRVSGRLYPVNALGRWLSPSLYTQNERLTFRFQSEEFGEVVLFCIGALGVSGLFTELGDVVYDRWTPLKQNIKKADRLLAFKLGSTVVMLTEKRPPSCLQKFQVQVAESIQ